MISRVTGRFCAGAGAGGGDVGQRASTGDDGRVAAGGMKSSLRQAAANKFPALGKVDRRLRGLIDSISPLRSSYSQHGEDAFVLDRLQKYDLSNAIYVDVGANHPTTISNTYLLYRCGMHGIVIEPNAELLQLHRRIRPRDIALGLGCGQNAGLSQFQILSTPALSHFAGQNLLGELTAQARVWRTEYIPILPLDLIVSAMNPAWIAFLSIDTEGFDFSTLLGAVQTLDITLFLCVEFSDPDEKRRILHFLSGNDFEVERYFACNILLRNTRPKFDRHLFPAIPDHSTGQKPSVA